MTILLVIILCLYPDLRIQGLRRAKHGDSMGEEEGEKGRKGIMYIHRSEPRFEQEDIALASPILRSGMVMDG